MFMALVSEKKLYAAAVSVRLREKKREDAGQARLFTF